MTDYNEILNSYRFERLKETEESRQLTRTVYSYYQPRSIGLLLTTVYRGLFSCYNLYLEKGLLEEKEIPILSRLFDEYDDKYCIDAGDVGFLLDDFKEEVGYPFELVSNDITYSEHVTSFLFRVRKLEKYKELRWHQFINNPEFDNYIFDRENKVFYECTDDNFFDCFIYILNNNKRFKQQYLDITATEDKLYFIQAKYRVVNCLHQLVYYLPTEYALSVGTKYVPNTFSYEFKANY